MVSAEVVQTCMSIAYVGVLVGMAFYAFLYVKKCKLPTDQQFVFAWLVFDALIHILLWREYSNADARWGVADPCIVSVEMLTVVLAGPLALYTAWLVLSANEKYHIYLCFLCICELYGDYMTFVPEWFTNAAALDTQNALHFWFYLVISNGVWVVLPVFLLFKSTCALYRMVDAASVPPTPPPKRRD